MRIRRWWWRTWAHMMIHRLWLFSRIVWRKHEEDWRISVSCAWDVACIVWDKPLVPYIREGQGSGSLCECVNGCKCDRSLILRRDGGYVEKVCGMGPSLDEIASNQVEHLHLERMDDNCYWIGLDLKDGRHVRIIVKAARARIHTWAEVEE